MITVFEIVNYKVFKNIIKNLKLFKA